MEAPEPAVTDQPSEENATAGPEEESSTDPGGPPDEEGKAAPDVHSKAEFGDLHNSNVEVTGAINHFNEQNQNFFGGTDFEALMRRELSRQDFEVVPAAQLRGRERSFVPVEENLEPVVECLVNRRIAMVVGERGLGKGAICLLAASRIAGRDPKVREVLMASTVDRTVRWRPDAWFEKKRGYEGGVLIFEDLFDDGNPDLSRFFDRLDETRLGAIQDRAAQANCYLLLTMGSEPLAGQLKRLLGVGVLCQVTAPDEISLVQALHRRLAMRPMRGGDGRGSQVDSVAQEFLDERGTWLAERLRTVPRAVRFVDELLSPVVQGEVSLEGALEFLDDLDHWLLRDLPQDPPRWSFVLALVLASADPRSRWTPWMAFHELWRTVEDALQQELRWWQEKDTRPLGRMVVDRPFLIGVRAEVRRLPYPVGDAVRFTDPDTAERLWRILLGPGRSILATLLPRLFRCAESEHSALRQLASRSIGRIGEMDPARLILARLSIAIDSDQDLRSLGETVVGALSSDDQDYISGCLGRIRSIAAGRSLDRKARALLVLTTVGSARPELVLGTLAGLLESRFEKIQIDPTAVKHRLNTIFGQLGPTEELGLKAIELLTRGVLEPDVQVLLVGTQFALVGLCFAGHSSIVFRRLGTWLGGSDARLMPWIALLALGDRGVLAILEDHPLRMPLSVKEADSPKSVKVSRILLAVEEAEEVEALARFLELAYAASESFPLRLRSRLRQNLLGRLDRWLRQASQVSVLRPRVAELLSCLRDSSDAALRKDVFDLLRQLSRHSVEKDSPHDLALDLLRIGVPGERMPAGNARTE